MSDPHEPLAHGSISLRMYPHELPAEGVIAEMRAQAALAEAAGFDGLMTSEHHGGFRGYLPNPLQAAGFLLDATRRAWAAPCPLLLPLRHWTQVAEDVAWLAARFPGRVGAGLAAGGLAQDFEMADLEFESRRAAFRDALPRLAGALRGRCEPPLADDAAIAACEQHPVPVVCAAQGPLTARRAAKLGIGVIYDSLQPPPTLGEVSAAHAGAGGNAPRILIRRAWIGRPPSAEVEAQMEFYRGYAARDAQSSWGPGNELVGGDSGEQLADGLAHALDASGCSALNLRVHLHGLSPATVRGQIERLGSEVLPLLRRRLQRRPRDPLGASS